jgi:hypothetical protein
MALWSSPGVIARECLEVGGGGMAPDTRLLGGDIGPETRTEERRFIGEVEEGIGDWPSAVIYSLKIQEIEEAGFGRRTRDNGWGVWEY